jgi:hypothetical protein
MGTLMDNNSALTVRLLEQARAGDLPRGLESV